MIPAAKSIVKGKNKDDRLTHCIAKFKKVMSLWYNMVVEFLSETC